MQTVEVPHGLGEVRFRREGDRLCVDYVAPVVWFPSHVLECSQSNPDVGLSFDGTHVTLHACNGRWIWKLTGRSLSQCREPGADPLVLLEGAWPD